MTVKEPRLRDAEHALVAALVAALAEPRRNRLWEARFGRHSDEGAGWWYSLQFLSEVGSSFTPQEETDGPRIDKIVRAWSKSTALYQGSEAPEAQDSARETA